MTLQEKILKTENELQKLEEKREKISEKIRDTTAKLESLKQQLKAEKNQKLASMIEKNIGELSEEKIKILDGLLKEQTEKFISDQKVPEVENSSAPEEKEVAITEPAVQNQYVY